MRVKRSDLLGVLTAVKPGLASKEIIEQSGSFIFEAGRIYTYNDEIAVIHSFKSDISGAVKAEELYNLLSKSKDDEIELTIVEGELRFKGKRSLAGIRMEEQVSLPISEIGKPKEFKPLPDDFVDAVKFASFSTAKDMTKPLLTCLNFSDNRVESCDNFRLTRYNFKSKYFPAPILLPAKAASELIKFKPAQYGIAQGWLHFKCDGGVTFACRTYQDKYPNIEHLIKVDGVKMELPADMVDVLERAGVFTKTEFDHDEAVEMLLEPGKLRVYGKGGAGWFKEVVKIQYSGEPVTFTINPKFLKEILSLLSTVTIGDNRLKMETKTFIHVVSLMVNKNTAASAGE